jgi:anthranilate synthase component 2
MITIIDNYDSFTFNLVQQIERLTGEDVTVVRNDAFDPAELLASSPDAIVISPGPGRPSKAGRIIELIRRNENTPLLGVCLGHQAIAEAFGAEIVRDVVPVHGKVSDITHEGAGLFRDCPNPMRAARYHSLIVEPSTLPDVFTIDARAADGTVMAIAHRDRPIFGVQFHPESIGTTDGDQIVRNFLQKGGFA